MAAVPACLRTERLTLRRWRSTDRTAFREMNRDPRVMATIGTPMQAAAADALLDRIESNFDRQGFGLWCVDLGGEPLGWTGLSIPAFMPGAVEVGWRLRHEFWGRGYATEAARAVVEDGFGRLGLDALVSFTAASNIRSRAVMERLGMVHDAAADFDHPSVPVGSPLRRHVLYHLHSSQWTSRDDDRHVCDRDERGRPGASPVG